MFQDRDTHEARNGGETGLDINLCYVVVAVSPRRKVDGAFSEANGSDGRVAGVNIESTCEHAEFRIAQHAGHSKRRCTCRDALAAQAARRHTYEDAYGGLQR